ncbi:MAG: hypothetical protein H0W63_09980 [Gemmatimonadaceae bacterium]|nr:hypothetical protein [Gemmatimonadaceae bacterium]
MTLLESIVALVIVGVFAVSCLELFQTVTVGARDSTDWATAVAYAEMEMETAKVGGAAAASTYPVNRGFTTTSVRTQIHAGLAEIVVIVRFPRGGRFELRRLVESP